MPRIKREREVINVGSDAGYIIGVVIGVVILCAVIPFLAPIWIIGGVIAVCRPM